jgi:hypothetical protein
MKPTGGPEHLALKTVGDHEVIANADGKHGIWEGWNPGGRARR